ncbi:MAG TPA: hypothetical protein VFP72_07365, partial [Kineosporiaceae bacterium]|nr:hypothetical protein [Kineosporiaceae bacterium]
GDGATAALLHPFTQDQDLLELLSITTRSAPQMEEMHRGADPFTPAPRSLSSAVDVKRAKKAFFEAGGLDRFGVVARQVLGDVIGVALERAGIAGDDPRLSAVILPRLGPPTLDLMYLPVVQELLKAPALVLGDLTGHLGAGDFLANLADVVEHGVLDADRFALVLGGGGGFSWTAAVVRRTDHRAA